jgi:hypothetical protein
MGYEYANAELFCDSILNQVVNAAKADRNSICLSRRGFVQEVNGVNFGGERRVVKGELQRFGFPEVDL